MQRSALRLIRSAESEMISGDLSQARDLRLGLVEDFDSEIAPELAQLLATEMPKCTFHHFTLPVTKYWKCCAISG
jgi:hypothetical protein